MSVPNCEYRCYVQGPWNTDNELAEELSQYGTLRDWFLFKDVNRMSRGFGYVTFAVENGMLKAIDAINGQIRDGYEVKVFQVQPRRNGGDGREWYQCVVRGLASTTKKYTVEDAFSKFGVHDVVRVKDGSWFVGFLTERGMRGAIEEMDGMELEGSSIIVNQFFKSGANGGAGGGEVEYRCYVDGLPRKTNEETLKRVFKKFGVLSAKVVHSQDDESCLGYGFVTFANEKDQRAAIAEKNGKKIDQCVVTVGEYKPGKK